MAQHVGRERLHVVGRHEVRPRRKAWARDGLRQRDGGARRGAELDERREIGQPRRRGRAWRARGRRCSRSIARRVAARRSRRARRGSPRAWPRHRPGWPSPAAMRRMISFSSSRDGYAHVQLEHEAVDLRLGQRIRPFLLDGVLRGEHEERLGQLERLPADGDLLLLHRLEQRRLHLGRRAVDLVGEHDVGEDRAAASPRIAPWPGRRPACPRRRRGAGRA